MRHLCALVFVGACSKDAAPTEITPEQALAKLPPEVNAKLDKAAAAAKELASADRNVTYAGPKLELMSIGYDKPPTGNAVLEYAPDMAVLDHPDQGKVPGRMLQSGQVTECWSAVRRKIYGSYPMYDGRLRDWKDETPIKGFQIDLLCRAIGAAQKLVVVEAKREAATAELGSGSGDKTFKSGGVVGNLLVWDLTTGKYEGSRQFSAKSSQTIDYTVKVDDRGNEIEPMAHLYAVDDDLNKNTNAAIQAALAR